MTDAVIPEAIAATLVDPAAYADDRIHDAYRWLRANNPLGIAQPPGYDPFWVVTRHADIFEVSRQNAAFHNGDRATTLVDRATDAPTAARTRATTSPASSPMQASTAPPSR